MMTARNAHDVRDADTARDGRVARSAHDAPDAARFRLLAHMTRSEAQRAIRKRLIRPQPMARPRRFPAALPIRGSRAAHPAKRSEPSPRLARRAQPCPE